jgi:hypothetical protein
MSDIDWDYEGLECLYIFNKETEEEALINWVNPDD